MRFPEVAVLTGTAWIQSGSGCMFGIKLTRDQVEAYSAFGAAAFRQVSDLSIRTPAGGLR
jgi:hypothetical protein